MREIVNMLWRPKYNKHYCYDCNKSYFPPPTEPGVVNLKCLIKDSTTDPNPNKCCKDFVQKKNNIFQIFLSKFIGIF